MNIEQIKYKTIEELKTITEQYKINKVLSDILFKQNYEEKQERILKEVFGE